MPSDLLRDGTAERPQPGAVRRPLPIREGLLTAAFAGLLVLALLGPLTSTSGLPMSGEGSPLRQGTYLIVIAMILGGLRPLTAPGRLLAVPLAMTAALAWCWISIAWSVAPDVALRRLILTSLIIWSAFAAVRALGYERSLLVIRIALVLALVANYVAVLLFPMTGIHQASEVYDKQLVGDWRGIMTQKNHAGAVSALAVIVFLLDARRIPVVARAAVVAMAGYFLYRTGSRTSLGDCIGATLIGLVFLRYNAKYRLLLLPVICLLVFAAGSITNFYADPLSLLFQKKATLSGRLDIWDALLRYSADNPLLGAGYGSFWNVGPASPIYQYGRGWLLILAQGHNGFLDLLVTLGIPGLLLVVGATVVWPLVRLFGHRGAGGQRGALVLAMIIFCVTHNSTESTLFDRDGIAQVFLMVAIALLCALTANIRDRGIHARVFNVSGKITNPDLIG